VGYALFQGGHDHYNYLSLMPAAVLTIVLALVPPGRAASIVAAAALALVLMEVPARLEYSAKLHKMPEYGALVKGSRRAARQGQPMRAIETEFVMPAPSDVTFVYRILGGRVDPGSPWIAQIKSSGEVEFRRLE
jgi:hypothetical protein